MSKGKTLIAGMTILLLIGMLVGLSFIAPIFAQELTPPATEEDPAGEAAGAEAGTQPTVVEETAYFGLKEAIEKAAAEGVITAEQAEELLARLAEAEETMVDGLFPGGELGVEGGAAEIIKEESIEFGGHFDPQIRLSRIADALQTAVEKGLITQEEADRIQADLEAGNLRVLLVSDEGVFTDPADIPADLQDLVPELDNPDTTAVIVHFTAGEVTTDVDIFIRGAEGLETPLGRFVPRPGVDGPAEQALFSPDILSAAVEDGLITAEQSEGILDHVTGQLKVVTSNLSVVNEAMPDAFLLDSLAARLQKAVADEAVDQAEADSLLDRLREIFE